MDPLTRLTLFLLACFLTLIQPAFSQPSGGTGSAPLAPVIAKAAQDGTAPVILQLATKPVQALKAPLAKTAQQTQISTLQTRVLNKLGIGKNAGHVKLYSYLPFLAVPLSPEQIKLIADDPDVVAVFPDIPVTPTLADSTPLIGATTAWSQGYSGAGKVVAILDTGVDKNHSFLTGKVVAEACFSSTGTDSTSVCPNGGTSQIGAGAAAPCTLSGCTHGTHVAGIAAGHGNTFSGVARDANIIAIQVFSNCGGSPCAYTSDLILAIEHVYSLRNSFSIASINMSLGGGAYTSACDSVAASTKSAIDLARSAGIATVIASGNDSFTNSISYPACISSAISVGSTTKADAISSFSNIASFLDLLAPGSSINSSVPGNQFDIYSGTSMATPHVAGAFAVLRSASPNASVDTLLSALKNTGITVIDNARSGSLGIAKPRIQVNAAIAALGGGSGGILSINPSNGLSASGPQGGPFAPTSQSYTLQNTGSASLNWQASEDVTWASLAPTSGTLAPNASVTVTLSLTAAATTLAAGNYTSSASFTNTSNGLGSTSRSLSLTVTPPPAANDKFQDGITLQGSTGSTLGSNVGASKESGEPAHGGRTGGASVWWRWVAPANGTVTFDTVGSNFDTLLGAYTGSQVSALTTIAGNDDITDNINLRSQITFPVQAGTLYHIAVDGYDAATGNIQLNWDLIPDQVSPGELAVAPTSEFSASGTAGGPFSPTTMVYTLTNVGGSNLSYVVQESLSWLSTSSVGGTLAPGASTTVTLSLNSAANSLTPGLYSGAVSFNNLARNVQLQVNSNGGSGNDLFINAITLSGTSASTSGNNTGASKESGEPNHGDNAGGRSLWWRWVAPANGGVTINTFGSNFDTTLGVYRGSSVSALTTIASNDDAGRLQSQVSFQAIAGLEYRIAVDGYNADFGNIQLSLQLSNTTRPANDDFAAAALLTGLSGTVNASNQNATLETGEPAHDNKPSGSSVWWQWTPTQSGTVTIDTVGSDFDTLLAVYVGTSVSALNAIAADDDSAGSLKSRVTFNATAGTTYRIAVDGYGGVSGAIRLNYSVAGAGGVIFQDGFEN